MAFTVSYVLQLNMLYFLICDLSIGIGFYMFETALTKEIKADFTALGVCLKSEPNPLLLLKQLSDSIQFHAIMKR